MSKPLLRGGQGRTAEDVMDMIDSLWWLWMFCPALAAWSLIERVVG